MVVDHDAGGGSVLLLLLLPMLKANWWGDRRCRLFRLLCAGSIARDHNSVGDRDAAFTKERQRCHNKRYRQLQVLIQSSNFGLDLQFVAYVYDAGTRSRCQQCVRNFQHMLVALLAVPLHTAGLFAHNTNALRAHITGRTRAVIHDVLHQREFHLVNVRFTAIGDQHLHGQTIAGRAARSRNEHIQRNRSVTDQTDDACQLTLIRPQSASIRIQIDGMADVQWHTVRFVKAPRQVYGEFDVVFDFAILSFECGRQMGGQSVCEFKCAVAGVNGVGGCCLFGRIKGRRVRNIK